jgi:hypothetical protein
MSERSEKVVYAAIDALNEQLAVGQRLPKSPMTPLLGRGGKLDSLGYINLVVLLEEQCKQQCGIEVSLNEASITESNPFETITSLVNHLDGLIQKK